MRFGILNLICGQISGVKTSTPRPKSISISGRIQRSKNVKTEIVAIAVSALRSLDHWQQCNWTYTKLGDQIVELQALKNRYPHLRSLPNQNYNLDEVQVIRGQDWYDIHHPFEFKKAEGKTAPKVVWDLSGPLQAKQAATLATTATSIADDKLGNQLNKQWDIESYASKCDVTGHSKDEQWAIKTLEQTTQFNGDPRNVHRTPKRVGMA